MRLWTLFVAILLIFTVSGCSTQEKQNVNTGEENNKGPNYSVIFKERAENDYTVTQEDLQMIRDEGGVVIESFSALGIVLVKLTEKQAEAIRHHERVLKVEKYSNEPVTIE